MNETISLDFFHLVGLAALVFFYIVLMRLARIGVERFGRSRKIAESRILYMRKFFKLLLVLMCTGGAAVILGIDFRHIWLVASSFFALVGIALFANWSILSNLTASTLLFFNFPYRIGDRIRIIDGENSIEGDITDMTLYYIQIQDEGVNQVVYPNNLILQKPVRCIRTRPSSSQESPDAPEEIEGNQPIQPQ